MIVSTLNYFPTYSPCLRHFSYRGSRFCTPSHKSWPSSFIVSNAQRNFVAVSPHALAGQKFLRLEKQVIITWCKFGTVHRIARKVPTWTVRTPTPFLLMHSNTFFRKTDAIFSHSLSLLRSHYTLQQSACEFTSK
jgi:hypothetical protein